MLQRTAGLCKMATNLSICEVSGSGRLHDVLDHVTPIFIRDEPLSRCFPPCRTGGRERDFRRYAERDLRSGYSVMALDEGRVVGACLCKPLDRQYVMADHTSNEDPEDEDPLNSSVVELLSSVHRRLDLFSRYSVPTLLDIALLSVEHTHGGRGLATQLVRASLSLAAQHGLRLAKADCTGPQSAKACQRAGMSPVYCLPYSDYLVDGRQVFQGASGSLTVVVTQLVQPENSSS